MGNASTRTVDWKWDFLLITSLFDKEGDRYLGTEGVSHFLRVLDERGWKEKYVNIIITFSKNFLLERNEVPELIDMTSFLSGYGVLSADELVQVAKEMALALQNQDKELIKKYRLSGRLNPASTTVASSLSYLPSIQFKFVQTKPVSIPKPVGLQFNKRAICVVFNEVLRQSKLVMLGYKDKEGSGPLSFFDIFGNGFLPLTTLGDFDVNQLYVQCLASVWAAQDAEGIIHSAALLGSNDKAPCFILEYERALFSVQFDKSLRPDLATWKCLLCYRVGQGKRFESIVGFGGSVFAVDNSGRFCYEICPHSGKIHSFKEFSPDCFQYTLAPSYDTLLLVGCYENDFVVFVLQETGFKKLLEFDSHIIVLGAACSFSVASNHIYGLQLEDDRRCKHIVVRANEKPDQRGMAVDKLPNRCTQSTCHFVDYDLFNETAGWDFERHEKEEDHLARLTGDLIHDIVSRIWDPLFVNELRGLSKYLRSALPFTQILPVVTPMKVTDFKLQFSERAVYVVGNKRLKQSKLVMLGVKDDTTTELSFHDIFRPNILPPTLLGYATFDPAELSVVRLSSFWVAKTENGVVHAALLKRDEESWCFMFEYQRGLYYIKVDKVSTATAERVLPDSGKGNGIRFKNIVAFQGHFYVVDNECMACYEIDPYADKSNCLSLKALDYRKFEYTLAPWVDTLFLVGRMAMMIKVFRLVENKFEILRQLDEHLIVLGDLCSFAVRIEHMHQMTIDDDGAIIICTSGSGQRVKIHAYVLGGYTSQCMDQYFCYDIFGETAGWKAEAQEVTRVTRLFRKRSF